ncbi:MAG: ATP-binding protein [Chloroflexi bacterium]|nr:ATP-binding protein [Chloroflexota bacterium]
MASQPWHQACALREDVRHGELTLAEFAADLNDVRTGDAPLVYREPAAFFDRTYPTHRMKELASDVLQRLAGAGGKPVLRLQVAYGGGKTHTLITLLHLAERGRALASHRTVSEFLAFADLPAAPQAIVALLPGDKIDVKEGLEVYGPDGSTRRVKTLWGALAYQLAGEDGYARLRSHEEDFVVPAEPLLVDLLRAPTKKGLGALVVVDEAVWYYRGLVNSDPRMLGTVKDFYQVLTQAVAKVDRAALVASLIASRVEANDQTGTQCLAALDDIFGRIAEPVDPVTREDVAEVLRRRLFERVPGEEERRLTVDATMAAMRRLPLRDDQRDQTASARLMASYPFHPELINVLYQKWTQMNGFQRTRGALRLLAYAMRDSEGVDSSPLVGPGALLPGQPAGAGGATGGLSNALNELVELCDQSEKWTPILSGELDKAREIQIGLPSLKARELEQAVLATFLHSQPHGQRAASTDLLALLPHPEIDPAALEEGLRKWRERSWFLTENSDFWQLGTTPNLTHMHVMAMGWLNESEIDDDLRKRIQRVPALTAADPGVEVHNLPNRPRDIGDDLKLHYLILSAECAVELGKPLPRTVTAFFDEKTGPHDPRIYRNNILALAPDSASLAGLREHVRRWLG